MGDEEDEDNDDHHEITTKLRLVLAAKSRRLQYTSSPLHVRHVSLLSSPDDIHSRASIPFSWEEEPGKPKHCNHLLPPTCLDLPPRLLEFTKIPATPNHQHHDRLFGFKRWFRWRKGRADDVFEKGSFVFSTENKSAMKILRRGHHHCCLLDVPRCYFEGLLWKNKKLKNN